MEIDALVVHVGGENISNSTVYFIECGFNPELKKVEGILERLETFKNIVKHEPHFKTSTQFFPVFGAKQFSPIINTYCYQKKIWQVRPSGASYEVIRNYCTVSRFVSKLFR